MPIAKIQLPDGKIGRFEVPEGTTPEQVMQFAQSMDLGQQQPATLGPATSTTGGFQQQAPQEQLNLRQQLLRETAQEMGPVEAFATGAGRGLTSFVRGIAPTSPEARQRFAQTLPLLGTPQETLQALTPTQTEQEAVEALRAERPISTGAGEIVGEAAPFLPVGGLTGAIERLPARAAATGLLGGTEAGVLARGGEGNVPGAVGLGTAVGVGAEVLLPVVSRVGRKIFQRLGRKPPSSPIIDAAGNPTPEFQDALNASGISFEDLTQDVRQSIESGWGQLEPSQMTRKEFLEAQGIQPTKAQVTREAADFQAQQEAAKTSGRVRTALENQEAVLTTRFNDAIRETGGRASAPSVSVIDSVVDKATMLDRQISDLYKAARERAPQAKNVRFNKLTETLRKYAPANTRTGGNISAIVGEMKNKGILDKGFKIKGKVDVEAAEDIRKTMNALYDPQNGYGNQVLRELKEALDDDVFRASGEDIYRQARKAKSDFESELTRSKISKFDSRKQNLVRDVLENKIDPDQFVDKVIFGKSWRADDLEQLKNYTGSETAWNDLKADVLSSIRDNAFIGPEDASGFRSLSRDRLERTLDRIGPKKLSVIFSPGERRFLNDMLRVSKLREPVRGTAIGKGPTAQAVASLERKLKDLPVLGGLVNFINIDASGRIALKANPQKITRQLTMAERTAPGIIAPAGIAATMPGQQER